MAHRASGQETTQSLEEAKQLIADAISIGAPLYNSGDIIGCARLYRSAAEKISPLLPPKLQSSLQGTLQTQEDNCNSEAWAFRRQFDFIIAYQAPFTPASARNTHRLDSFTSEQVLPQPRNIDDNVMGGVSQGQWIPTSNTFFGYTSLKNNGGFSSLRWRCNSVQNWSDAKGIFLRVKHSDPENHTFCLILKDSMCEQIRGANFKSYFCNPEGEDAPILIPFTAFNQIEQMGRQLRGPALNPAKITEVGLMAIKPSIVGQFEIAMEDWGLYY
eukprot:CAMPEP_0113938528 /NCGR_PEP_ID=MMETSP1339-20121228/4962_1 /TAXON_ID=94617 /ORGANISM="Fibrocapsa japonica" /LENGTH=271 /DNA_ID=CAMNT_0000941689 /DNA_START=93 /DNA_END=908 /DNA_ORIENTATION=+ /assembly_acc=CAM_ASM_000762